MCNINADKSEQKVSKHSSIAALLHHHQSEEAEMRDEPASQLKYTEQVRGHLDSVRE